MLGKIFKFVLHVFKVTNITIAIKLISIELRNNIFRSVTLSQQDTNNLYRHPKTACRHLIWSLTFGSRQLARLTIEHPIIQVDDRSFSRSPSLRFDHAHPSIPHDCSSRPDGRQLRVCAFPGVDPIFEVFYRDW